MLEDNAMNRQNDHQNEQDSGVPAQAAATDHSDASLLNLVPPSRVHCGTYDEIGVYGMSLQGRSHKKTGTPCQDSNNFCYLEKEKILIAAIADGVGSCIWSHWGSYMAVEAVILSLKKEIAAISKGEVLKIESLSGNQIESMFNAAFSAARCAVEDLADREKQSVYNFQSTLTAALYDGSRLTCCHIGDDGIVAQGASGKYQMITQRIKGDEANSVVTLQSGKWYITTTSTEVTGFLMSTDGILDSYVMNQAMNNRVYYPFFEACIYSMGPRQIPDALGTVEAAMKETETNLMDDARMGSVTDDMTVLAVANQRLLCESVHPSFSQAEWDRERYRILKMQQEKLHPRKERKVTDPASQSRQIRKTGTMQKDISAEPVSQPPNNNRTGPAQQKTVPDPRRRGEAGDRDNRKSIPRDPQKAKKPSAHMPPNPYNLPYAVNSPYRMMSDMDDKEKNKGFSETARGYVAKVVDGLGKGMFGGIVIEVEEVPVIPGSKEPVSYRNEPGPRSSMTRCPTCRRKLEGKERYCPDCGTQLRRG